MTKSLSPTAKAREEREKRLILKHKYETRITVVKFGKEALDAGDYALALKRFIEYTVTLAEVKGTQDAYSLTINHFDAKKELTEMLMLSHVFFEMARIYDAIPKFHSDAQKCLDQFVQFSTNQPYQVVNSELVRKHLKNSIFKNQAPFRNAYQQIFIQSRKCFIVTFCYGETHPITLNYRKFKDRLLDSHTGQEIVRLYYTHSSTLVEKYKNNFFFKSISLLFIKPILLLFSKIVLPFILK